MDVNRSDPPTCVDVDRSSSGSRQWLAEAISTVQADANRSADTHLIPLAVPEVDGIDVYLKDESTHPTGSLKHRLARSLFLYGLCSGWLEEGTTVIEASSGSTAVSEAYFARMLGLPFVAVVPRGTSPRKLALIERQGGRCHYVDEPSEIYAVATRLAAETGGCYLDQFTNAERATDWRGNNNIAESIFAQMQLERHPVPTWVVVGAGTGGTSATIGRFVRYHQVATRLAVVDPEGSVFFRSWCEADPACVSATGSRIEGIGRARVEPSFIPTVIDRMLKIPDRESIVAMRRAEEILGRRVGPSTGTNLAGVLRIARGMLDAGETGSIVSLLCDDGDRYSDTFHDAAWLVERDLAPE